MRRVVTTVAVVVVVLVVAFFGVRALRAGQRSKTPNVAVATAYNGPLTVNVTGSGTVQAATSVNVNAQEPGTVTSVPVEVGSRVQAGQILATVADTQGTLSSNLLSAEAQLAADEASLTQLVAPTPPSADQVQADTQRIAVDRQNIANEQQKIVADRQNIPNQKQKIANDKLRIANDQQAIANQQQTIANQQQKIASDEQNLQYLAVSSPVSGLISSVGVGVGQNVGQGTTVFQVVQPTEIDVQTSVPEIDLPNIYVGQGVQVWTQDQGTMQAVVQTIGVTSSGSNRQGALFPVTLSVENPPTGLRAGMNATADFTQAYLTETGTIAFAGTQAVTAQVSGTVLTVALQAGQTVQAGETVLTLSNPSLDTQLSSDQAQLSSDQAQLSTEQTQLASDQLQVSSDETTLISDEAVPNSDKAQLGSDQAQLSSDQAALQQLLHPTPPAAEQVASQRAKIAVDQQSVQRARNALADLNIASPIAGIVTAVNVQPGDTVAQGSGVTSANSASTTMSASTAPFAVEAPNSLQILVPISEVSIAQVRVGQRVVVTSDALPGRTFFGTVALISPAGTNSSGVANFNVIVTVARPGSLLAGMSASVTVDVAFVPRALLVPVEAVSGTGRAATVEVVKNGRIRVQRVATGLSNDVAVQILAGLAAGDKVVTATVSTSTSTPGFGGGAFRSRSGSQGGGFGGNQGSSTGSGGQ